MTLNNVSSQIVLDSITDGSGYTYIASPIGSGPFPCILYNHGGLGISVGGDLRSTAIALAQAGYLVRCEKRMETVPLAGHLQEVENALDNLRADTRADTSCVGIMGFSRGGYLTLEAAKMNPDKIHYIIAMAPANPNNLLYSLASNLSSINDPVLILVSNNDTIQDNHVLLAQMIYDSLIANSKIATHIIYPAYDSNGDMIVNENDDGHELFFYVQNPYWSDIINFLNSTCNTGGINPTNEAVSLDIYPIPISKQAILQFNKPLSNATLIVYNYLGEKIIRIDNISSQSVSLSQYYLSSGVFIVQIIQDNNELLTKEIVIND